MGNANKLKIVETISDSELWNALNANHLKEKRMDLIQSLLQNN